jgi:spore cortex formation protein SpoVR/YcgB (stage V sporulation)
MLDSYRDLVDGLLETPTTLRDALGDPVGDVSPDSAARLRELRAREAVNLRRAQAIMRRDHILLRAIEDEPEIVALANPVSSPATPEEDLATFSHDRSELISLLVNLTLKDWERPVDHDRTGETTLADEIEDHLTWDEAITARITT